MKTHRDMDKSPERYLYNLCEKKEARAMTHYAVESDLNRGKKIGEELTKWAIKKIKAFKRYNEAFNKL